MADKTSFPQVSVLIEIRDNTFYSRLRSWCSRVGLHNSSHDVESLSSHREEMAKLGELMQATCGRSGGFESIVSFPDPILGGRSRCRI